MTTPLTVKELKRFCEEQIAHWRWDNYVYISSDDEGNMYHPLFFQFTANPDDIQEYELHDEPMDFGVDYDWIVLLG